jgi:hypothetical protein
MRNCPAFILRHDTALLSVLGNHFLFTRRKTEQVKIQGANLMTTVKCVYDWMKVKLSLCYKWAPHHKGVLGEWGIATCIFNLSTRRWWFVSFTPWPLYYQVKSPWYPLDRRLGGPQSWSRRGGEEKNSQPLPGLEPPIIQPRSPALYH